MIKISLLERPDTATFGLAALNVVLLGALVTIVLWPISEDKPDLIPVAITAAVARTAAPVFSAPQLPLFGRSQNGSLQTAKPTPQIASAVPPPALAEPRPLQWRVTGIVLAEGAAPIALIERKGQAAETRRVTVGVAVEDWLVEDIAPRTVSLRRGRELIAIDLDPTNNVNQPR